MHSMCVYYRGSCGMLRGDMDLLPNHVWVNPEQILWISTTRVCTNKETKLYLKNRWLYYVYRIV